MENDGELTKIKYILLLKHSMSVKYIIDSGCPSGTHYISVGASMVPIYTLDSVELFSINTVY